MKKLDTIIKKAKKLGEGEKIRIDNAVEIWQILLFCMWVTFFECKKWSIENLMNKEKRLNALAVLERNDLLHIRETILKLLDKANKDLIIHLKPLLDGIEFCLEVKIAMNTEPNIDELRCKISRLVDDYAHLESALPLLFVLFEQAEKQMIKSPEFTSILEDTSFYLQ